jgi:predicted RNA-binding protein with RPS1 domain
MPDLSGRLVSSISHGAQPDNSVDALQGKVSWIESYGAFVDVALEDGRSVSGLIHLSELSWNLVVVPETVVSVGAGLSNRFNTGTPSGSHSLVVRQ